MIYFNNVHIGYTHPLISIPELELKAGELYILAGKNGAGKSTLLKTISQQLNLLKGEILFNKESLFSLEISKHISFVKSTFPAIEFMKTEQYIALGRTPHTNALGRLKATDYEIINAVFDQLGIQHLKNRYTNEISDGERQLVSIAKALAQETPMIILDEPTAFLDYSNKLMVLNKLKEIAKTLNKCIVLSSHDLDLCIESNCNFLMINHQTKTIDLFYPPIDKRELLISGFD